MNSRRIIPNIHLIHCITQLGCRLPTKRLSHVGEGGLCDINGLLGMVPRFLGRVQAVTFMSHKVENEGGGGVFGVRGVRLAGAGGGCANILSNFPENFLGKR